MLFDVIFRACRSADLFRSRKPMDVFCSVVEEVGELATELAVAGGGSYKKEGPDGVLGEIIDVISSVTDLAFVTDHGLSELVLLERVCPKLDKWLGKLAGVRCSVFVDSFKDSSCFESGDFEVLFDGCVRDKLAEWLNYCNELEKEKRGLKSNVKCSYEDEFLSAFNDPGFWLNGGVEVEKPTAYDSLIGSVGTTIVPDSQTFHGQMQRMSQKAMDDIAREEDARAWGALLAVASESAVGVEAPVDGVNPVRMLFLELALGARFRYIVDGVASERVWIKLSDWSARGEKIGLIAEYDSKFITHRNWVGQSLCCAEDTVAKCEELVVELVG